MISISPCGEWRIGASPLPPKRPRHQKGAALKAIGEYQQQSKEDLKRMPSSAARTSGPANLGPNLPVSLLGLGSSCAERRHDDSRGRLPVGAFGV